MSALEQVRPGLLEELRSDLAVLDSPGDARLLADKAEALRQVARKARAGLTAQNRCAEVSIWAAWTGGRMLKEMGLKSGPKPIGATMAPILGVESETKARHISSRWQRIASLPKTDVQAFIAAAFEHDRELTSHGALQLARTVTAQDPVVRPRLHAVPAGRGLYGLHGTFSTIVADPPWQYDNRSTRNAAEKHYPTMTVEELCGLDVEAHAADDSHLYLWTTAPFLREAFEVVEAWGFTYKTNLVWVKPQMGMGNYFRISHEHVLFAVRGSAPIPPAKRRMSWFEASRTQHSAKPDSFIDLVEHCSPGPGLEMFARRRRLGAFEWSYWGNEA